MSTPPIPASCIPFSSLSTSGLVCAGPYQIHHAITLQPGGGLLKNKGSAIVEPEQRPTSSAMANPPKTIVHSRYKPRQNEARRFTTENPERAGFQSIKGSNQSGLTSPRADASSA